MRHRRRIWNAMWSDMFIETTFMRYGHGPGGLIGITLKKSTMQRWALSLHECSRLLKSLSDMTDMCEQDFDDTHKEEADARITTDTLDRENIQNKLAVCVNPMTFTNHSDYIVNIVTGKLSSIAVNVDRSVCIGSLAMQEFEDYWPQSFHTKLCSKVVTMIADKKAVQSDMGPIHDTGLTYSRVMGRMSCSTRVSIRLCGKKSRDGNN